MACVIGGICLLLAFFALRRSTAVATEREHGSINRSLIRECDRYALDYNRVFRAYSGESEGAGTARAWWDYVIVAAAVGVFIWLGLKARVPTLSMNYFWVSVLCGLLALSAVICGWGLWKKTRFS